MPSALWWPFFFIKRGQVQGQWQIDYWQIDYWKTPISGFAWVEIFFLRLRIPPSFQNFTRKSVDYLSRRKIVWLALNGHTWSLYYLNSHSTFLISCIKSMTHNHDVINQQFATSDQKLNMLFFSKPDEWKLNWMFPWSF